MFRSIRWRLVASYVILTLLTVSLVGVLALLLIERYVEQQEQEYLASNAQAVARQALPLMQPVAHQTDLHELARTAAFLGDAQVRILDEHHHVLADSGQPTHADEYIWIMTSVSDHQAPGVFLERSIMVVPFTHLSVEGDHWEEPWDGFEQLSSDVEFSIVHRTHEAWGSRFTFELQDLQVTAGLPVTEVRVLQEALASQASAPFHPERTVTIPIGEAELPMGYVELMRGAGFGAQALATARRAFLSAAGGAALLAVIVGLLVSRGLTAPLRELTAAASEMSGGDLSIRAPARGKDEIGRLAQQFNHMAERLEASFAELAAERDNLRRFIADASHGLRTPITALKSFNELLQGAASDDPSAHAEFLAESQIQLERLEWITRNLLDLSRLDAGLITLDVSEHDAGELIETAAAAFKTLAREKNVTLSILDPSSALQISCDRARLELALSNLLDNGLKFTPPGGRVEIGAGRDGQTACLWVQDSGPGIAPAEQQRIFERFYRGPSDEPGEQVEGHGLGLSIVRSIAQAHGGRVTVETEPGAGSRFVIELPLATPSFG